MKALRTIAVLILLAIPTYALASSLTGADSCCPDSDCCPGCPMCPDGE